jgi:hypothetical protein
MKFNEKFSTVIDLDHTSPTHQPETCRSHTSQSPKCPQVFSQSVKLSCFQEVTTILEHFSRAFERFFERFEEYSRAFALIFKAV